MIEIGNAAGTCKNYREVARLARSDVSTILLGAITCRQRDERSGDTYRSTPLGAVNAIGLANPGADAVVEHLLQPALDVARSSGKKLGVSVAGFSVEEYVELAYRMLVADADFVELDLGCPNAGEGIPGFDPGRVESIVRETASQRVGVKLPPYSDPGLLREIASVLRETPPAYVALSNTFANALMLDGAGLSVLDPGFGGLSGPAVKAINLGQLTQMRMKLVGVPLVGVGGIRSGRDVWEYAKMGASSVQVGTAFLDADESIFARLLAEYAEIEEDAL